MLMAFSGFCEKNVILTKNRSNHAKNRVIEPCS